MVELVFLFLLFIVASGVLAMVDSAMLSVSRAEAEEMVVRQKMGAAALRSLVIRLPRAVSVIVIFTNTINVLGPILIGERSIDLYGHESIGVVTAVLTFLTIIFSEIIPKSLGAHYAPLIARLAAPVLLVLVYILFPLVYVLEKVVGLFKRGSRKIGTEDQIRALASIGRRAGHIDEDERQIIQKAFILNDRRARDIMTPRAKIVAIKADMPVRDASRIIFDHSYSRYPVTGRSLDDVRGLALSRDILGALVEGDDSITVSELTGEILFVSAAMRCDDLLAHFRSRKIHIAVVREREKTGGIVTLEDALEELVGEIEDEGDKESAEGRGK